MERLRGPLKLLESVPLRTKLVMGFFFDGNLLDAAITHHAISNNEVWELGIFSLVNPEADINQLILAKMAVITTWTGICAVLAAKSDRQRPNRFWGRDVRRQVVADGGLAVGNIVIWTVVTWNLANLAFNRIAGQ